MADFARKKGSKDKTKRKSKLLKASGLLGAASIGAVGGIASDKPTRAALSAGRDINNLAKKDLFTAFVVKHIKSTPEYKQGIKQLKRRIRNRGSAGMLIGLGTAYGGYKTINYLKNKKKK